MEAKERVVVGTQVARKGFPGDDLIEHPTNRHATEISTLNAKANDPACEHVHHHHDPVAAQEHRFAAEQINAPQAVLPRRSVFLRGFTNSPWTGWRVDYSHVNCVVWHATFADTEAAARAKMLIHLIENKLVKV